MCDLNNEINILILGIDIGLFNYVDAKRWADSVIERQCSVSDSIYDIAFLSSTEGYKLKSLLYQIRKPEITTKELPQILGIFYHRIIKKEINIKDAMDILYNIIHQEYYLDLNMDCRELKDIFYITTESDLTYINGEMEMQKRVINRLINYGPYYNKMSFKL